MLSVALLIVAMPVIHAQPRTWPQTPQEARWQGSDAWREADFAVLASELSPAVLISSKASSVRLFAGLAQWGVGGPAMVAFHGGDRAQVRLAPARVRGEEMAQPWLLVAFAGAPGWQWDLPWLVVLQHRPRAVFVSDEGLNLDFDGPAGFVAVMPLHGAWKMPISEAGLPGRSEDDRLESGEPWSWAESKSLPNLTAERCDRLSRALRYWPLNCREEIQVVPGADTLRVRCQFEYVEITDDWGTEGIKTAPLPPTLGLALRTGFPADASKSIDEMELEISSAYGECPAQEGDSYTIDFPFLQYVNETETQRPPNTDDPIVALAAEQVADRMIRKFTDGEEDRIWDHGGDGNYCWQVMGDRYYAKALAYTPEPARSNAIQSMRSYVRNWVLNADNGKYKRFRGKLILEGPGIGNWGGYDDSGKFSSNTLETLWWYAHCTGDWDIIRERWDTIQQLFITPREIRWRGVGRDAIAEMGDEAAPPLCIARMAYQIGDMDMYAYASYIFMRELVHLWVKTHPACGEYFRYFAPWHNMEPMDGRLFLTNLWGDIAGWQIDGPDYPRQTGERQYRNRWVRFGHEDVARFFRDHMGDIVREELDWWATRQDSPYKPGNSTAHIAPSMEQLRSLLLNESPEELAKLTPMQEARIGRAADAISYYLSFVRTGRPAQQTRLIPKDLPISPWILGLEREYDGSDGCLVVRVSTKEGHWPVLSDWGWKPPREAADLPGAKRWSYGQIIGGDTPPELEWERLSWTTNVWYND